jgi:hypothetical protein
MYEKPNTHMYMYDTPSTHMFMYMYDTPNTHMYMYAYDLRNSNTYAIPNCRLEMTKWSFFPSTTRNWNNLNPEIRNSGIITILKEKIKYYLGKCLFISVEVIEN